MDIALTKSTRHRSVVRVVSGSSELSAIRTWCEKTYGPPGRKRQEHPRWRHGQAGVENYFHFKNATDATLFLIKWA